MIATSFPGFAEPDGARSAPDRSGAMKGVVAYQGEPGAFAHEACRMFLPDCEPDQRGRASRVADAVLAGEAELGMLPLENNSAGAGPGDRRADRRATACTCAARSSLPIRLHLMALPGATLEEIETVVSHPMALAQCAQVLERLGLDAEEAINTAVAAPVCSPTAATGRRPRSPRGRGRGLRFDDPVPRRP